MTADVVYYADNTEICVIWMAARGDYASTQMCIKKIDLENKTGITHTLFSINETFFL